MSRLGQGDGRDGRDIAYVDRADPGVTGSGEELFLAEGFQPLRDDVRRNRVQQVS